MKSIVFVAESQVFRSNSALYPAKERRENHGSQSITRPFQLTLLLF